MERAQLRRWGLMNDETPTASTLRSGDLTPAPDEIGPYRLRSTLGEGGFGIVYLAEQIEPVRRRVALKIIKPGMDSKAVIARFEAERQALAMMDHPSVAKVFDGGVTDRGLPYFVMELVEGEPITEFCDRNRLTLKDRIELFIRVCDAVQHAHTKGVIHRDLKPSNILVAYDHDGRAQPKVIDFGVAKALHQQLTEATIFTQQGQLVGTPEYMSPEQAEMGATGIDTRADVYSLGVLLYELLTGMRPFDLRQIALAEMQRVIRETEPAKPSTRLSTAGDDEAATRIAQARRTDLRTLPRRLRGDLDWVVMRCLEKDRERRYDTANALSIELRRYLDDEPVLAGPPSAGYRIGKFVKRNRVGVLVGGLVAAALFAAAVVSVAFAVVAERERRRTAAALDELRQVADFQAEQLGEIDPTTMGVRLRRLLIDAVPEERRDDVERSVAGLNFTDVALETLQQNIFGRTVVAIDEQFADQPLVRAQLLQTVATTLRTVGLLDLASGPQERALAIRRQVLGDEHPDTLTSIKGIGDLLQEQGRLSEAEEYFREALDGRRRVLGDEHLDTQDSLADWGFILVVQGRLSEAEGHFRRVLQWYRDALGDEHPKTLASLHDLAFLLEAQGRLSDAELLQLEALQGLRRVLGEEHPMTLNAVGNMGTLLSTQGRLSEAEAYHLEVLDGRRRVLGNDHPNTLTAVNNMGVLLAAQGRLPEAEVYYLEALDRRRAVLGDGHPDTLTTIDAVGHLRWSQGRLLAAEPYFLEALEGRRRELGDDHPLTLESINNVGTLLRDQGRLSEAATYFRESLHGLRLVLGDEHVNTLISISNMALLLADLDEGTEALVLANEAVEAGRSVLGEDHWLFGNLLGKRGRAMESLGRFPEAAADMQRSHIILIAVLGEHHPQTQRVVGYLADLYTAWHAAEPGNGYDVKAAEWRAKLTEADP
jgi:serine/threonine protein kinase/tetratricopeptide (TPR) repeat protein